MEKNQNVFLRLLPLLMLVITTAASWYFEDTLAFRGVTLLMALAAIFLYFRAMPYFLILLTLLFGASSLFNLVNQLIFVEWVTFLTALLFVVLILITGQFIRQFLEFEWFKEKISRLLALGLVLTEFFWVLSLLAADPLVKAALLVVIFHILIGITKSSARLSYPLIGGIFFLILLKLL